MKIIKAEKVGFCFGVKRALGILERAAGERGGVETLGAVVHNEQVLERLAKLGVKVVKNVADIKGGTVVTSSHGISPQVEAEIRARNIEIISSTCPFVRRAQVAARRLAEAGFSVVIYGEADHPEVRGILGWAEGKGLATLDEKIIAAWQPVPRRLGILSQTTQIPEHFTGFVKKVIDIAFGEDSELRVIDTICHDIPERQAAALKLAREVDLMLVVGGHSSANTRRLVELCATATETHQVATAGEIQAQWLKNKKSVGVTAGASTAEETVDAVIARLEKAEAR